MTTAARRLSPHAVQDAGQHLVAAEALLRGYSAELRKHGRHGWVEINGRRVEVHIAKDEWPLTGALVQPEADAVVFVRRSTTPSTPHEYFIATRDEALTALDADMAAYLERHGGQRPRTPASDQQTVSREMAEPWRDCWNNLS